MDVQDFNPRRGLGVTLNSYGTFDSQHKQHIHKMNLQPSLHLTQYLLPPRPLYLSTVVDGTTEAAAKQSQVSERALFRERNFYSF